MFTEEVIVKVSTYNVDVEIPHFPKFNCVRPVSVITGTLVFVALASHVIVSFPSFQPTIPGFVLSMLKISLWLVVLAFVFNKLSGKDELDKVYNGVLEIDAKINSSMHKQRDWLLIFAASLIVSLATLILLIEIEQSEVGVLTLAFVNVEILNLAILKQVLVKRLRYMRSPEFMGRVDDTIVITRQLLEYNTKLNSSHELLVTTWTINTFQSILYYLYAVWAIYGAGVVDPYSPANYLIISLAIFILNVLFVVVLAVTSSEIGNEVDKMKLKMDITLAIRSCTEEEQSQIYLFLMELHHKPVQLSALGLYDVNNHGMSDACAIIISYLLVLIQYT